MRRWILMCFLATAVSPLWAQLSVIKGVVRDSTGVAISSALVTIHAGQFVASRKTDESGKFRFADVPAQSGFIEAAAVGFAPKRVNLQAGFDAPELQIVLHPYAVSEEMVVSAARTDLRVSEAPGSTVRLSSSDIAASPVLMVDDILRQIPGFTLFRRSTSRTANPTTQGVSLRGLGASGASRALVLVDGIPALDAFGAWVYWDRVPRAALADVEVFRGGASSLYGSNAMGGVVQLLTRTPEGPAIVLESSYGNETTPDLSFWVGTRRGSWDFDGAADLFRTDGFILVPVSQRGTVDTAANSEHGSGDFDIGHSLSGEGRIFVRGNFLEEFRHNGTRIQTNDTHLGSAALGIDRQIGGSANVQLRLYGDVQNYNQNFSAIATDRMSESLTNLQHVPSQQAGGTAQWTHRLGKMHTLIAGADLVEVIGSSQEQIFSSGTHIANSLAGGRQRTLGIFGEDVFRIQKWTVIPGLRLDGWNNFNGSSSRTSLMSGSGKSSLFPDRSETAFSPRLSVLRSMTQNVSLTGSVYRAFRAPTLNELYRTFRVGNIVTQNNAALRAERLTGAEAGLNISAFDRRLDLRGTFFWNDIVNPIANVTLSTTPSLITRQRQNLGRTRSRGVELDAVAHLGNHVQLSGGYAFTAATVVSFPADATLQGRFLPQVPRHQFTVEARYWNPDSVMLSVQGRFVGNQFDDDQNLLPLNHYFSLDLLAARSLQHGMTAFIAIENLLDQRYVVGRTPVPTLGPPILFRVGLRFSFAKKTARRVSR